ncbi:type VI secretion system-associated protein TagF [Methyloferula stellata]|uniref:type VI secretion system-associated protein TagF n=1 Tax=Methyloferula stellata TaxID=876270 RepID=UPI00037E0D78|nr:type VI secretion system-associated protein TagF [Methyloferula stellata]
MQYGLFGKLPARRDFIAHAVPRSFLRFWETWLEKSMSESRAKLGAGAWEETFRSAPIWRFWLGADVCGQAILGAFMPSMDAVGRYFPLTLIAMPDGDVVRPPNVDPRHAWFEKIEDILLSALAPDTSLDTVLEEIGNLKNAGAEVAHEPVAEPKFGTPLNDRPALPLAELFAVCRLAYQDCSVAATTFWWTAGGEGFRPVGLMRKHFPETRVFTDMLTGHFDPRGAETIAIGVKPL